MLIVGVDPGVSGAMAIAKAGQGVFDWYKLPGTQEETWDIWNSYKKNVVKVVVERISPRAEQGVRRITTSCVRYGWLQMMFKQPDRTWDVEFITASTWYKGMKLQKKWPKGWDERRRYRERKKVNRSAAKEMFPHLHVTHTNADALLICEYARRSYG